MSPLKKVDQELETAIRELATRIVIPKLGEFDDVWEIANRVCDRYDLEKKAA
jgi:hypothetical protein